METTNEVEIRHGRRMAWRQQTSPFSQSGVRSRLFVPAIEQREDRCLLAFAVVNADVFGDGGLRLVADFNQAVNAATVQASDLLWMAHRPHRR